MSRAPFKTVYFDVIGACNARCPYCLTGTRKDGGTGAIAPGRFTEILGKLLEAGIVDPRSVISLYNWGEPLLHPDLGVLVRAVNGLGLRYALSTNAARIPTIDLDFVKNLDHVIFSMCGFSQRSYDRIQGTDFEKAKGNIARFVSECRALRFTGRFVISYHVYRFNVEEMRPCEAFANRHGIVFNPYYAILNDWDELCRLVDGAISSDRLEVLSRDLFGLDEAKKAAGPAPPDYRCPQRDLLVVTESGDVMACCQHPKGRAELVCGNILMDDIAGIMERRESLPVCRGCIASGLAGYINGSIRAPGFYRGGWSQRFIRMKGRIGKLVSALSRRFGAA